MSPDSGLRRTPGPGVWAAEPLGCVCEVSAPLWPSESGEMGIALSLQLPPPHRVAVW